MADKNLHAEQPAEGSSATNPQSSKGENNPATSSSGAAGQSNSTAQNAAGRQSGRPDRSLCCADVLVQGCGWSVTADSEEELLGYMRSHARAAHGKSEFTSAELEIARHAILKRAA